MTVSAYTKFRVVVRLLGRRTHETSFLKALLMTKGVKNLSDCKTQEHLPPHFSPPLQKVKPFLHA